jgi:predicted TIM-barrel fold metal-dependent hydrolase
MNVIFHISTHVWNLNSVEPCHAKHLEWLIRRFPKVRFVLLHCSLPFIDEAMVLARHFPNVYLNMTWCHIIDRLQTIDLIKRCATTLPLNKVHAFGGDYSCPHCAVGHLAIARDNLYQGLDELIGRRMLSQAQAERIVRLWLYDNPKGFYW